MKRAVFLIIMLLSFIIACDPSYKTEMPDLNKDWYDDLSLEEKFEVFKKVSGYIDTPDYVEDGKNAIFVNPYDINGIIEKIRMVFSDQLLAEELGREARKSAEQNFSTRNMAEMLKNIFNTVARAS